VVLEHVRQEEARALVGVVRELVDAGRQARLQILEFGQAFRCTLGRLAGRFGVAVGQHGLEDPLGLVALVEQPVAQRPCRAAVVGVVLGDRVELGLFA